MDTKTQIVAWVGQIEQAKAEIAEHWKNIQKSLTRGHVDDAISLLNGYFSLKMELEQIEAILVGTLKASDFGYKLNSWSNYGPVICPQRS
jgi:hypothetical protein